MRVCCLATPHMRTHLTRGALRVVCRARRAQAAGARAVLFVNTDEDLFTLSGDGDGDGDGDITIAVACVGAKDGAELLQPTPGACVAVALRYTWLESSSESDSNSEAGSGEEDEAPPVRAPPAKASRGAMFEEIRMAGLRVSLA